WKIELLDTPDTSHHSFKNCNAAAQQWRQFGIETEYIASDASETLTDEGNFDVSCEWPGYEPWGAGVDLYRTLDRVNSAYVADEIGEVTNGHESRWSSPEMDAVIETLRTTDPADTE